jgi:HEPN domain-containing protein
VVLFRGAASCGKSPVKAVFQKLNAAAWGHSVLDLLKILSKKTTVSEDLLDCARSLDRYYLPTRYPNRFESGSPYEYFTRKDAEDALVYGRRIIEFCKGLLA